MSDSADPTPTAADSVADAVVNFVCDSTSKKHCSNPLSWTNNFSPSQNNFEDPASTAGCIIGFALFGCALLITVVMIFHDIVKRMKDYDEVIADDKAAMSQLGLDKEMP